MIISMIVGKTNNNCNGLDNGLPWRLSEDLKNFKKITMGHHMIMGRKTFESIGKALPGRTSLVLSRSTTIKDDRVYTFDKLEKALDFAKNAGEDEVFITGGAKIYEQTLERIDRLYLTQIDTHIEGDAFFPEINMNEWNILETKEWGVDEKNHHPAKFFVLEKKR